MKGHLLRRPPYGSKRTAEHGGYLKEKTFAYFVGILLLFVIKGSDSPKRTITTSQYVKLINTTNQPNRDKY